MYLYEKEHIPAFIEHFKETREERSRMVLAKGDTDDVYFYLKLDMTIGEKWDQIYLHNKEDVDSGNIYTNGFLHHERYIGEQGDEKRTVVVDCKNITGSIRFGMLESTQTEIEMFKKRRTQITTDVTDPKQFDPTKSCVFKRTVIVTDTIISTGDYITNITNQLHIYKPDINDLVKIVTTA